LSLFNCSHLHYKWVTRNYTRLQCLDLRWRRLCPMNSIQKSEYISLTEFGRKQMRWWGEVWVYCDLRSELYSWPLLLRLALYRTLIGDLHIVSVNVYPSLWPYQSSLTIASENPVLYYCSPSLMKSLNNQTLA